MRFSFQAYLLIDVILKVYYVKFFSKNLTKLIVVKNYFQTICVKQFINISLIDYSPLLKACIYKIFNYKTFTSERNCNPFSSFISLHKNSYR